MSAFEYIIGSHGLSGVKTRVYTPSGTYPQKGQDDYALSQTPDVVERLDPNQPEIRSWMGTPVFDRLTLKDPESGLSIDIDTVLFEVTNQRNIVKTQVQGMSETVKELITNSDFDVNIKGAIFHINPLKYPFDDMSTLISLCSVESELDCTSDFLSLFNIYHLVVEKLKVFQSAGSQNYQSFELKCVSDNPIELKVEEQS